MVCLKNRIAYTLKSFQIQDLIHSFVKTDAKCVRSLAQDRQTCDCLPEVGYGYQGCLSLKMLVQLVRLPRNGSRDDYDIFPLAIFIGQFEPKG